MPDRPAEDLETVIAHTFTALGLTPADWRRIARHRESADWFRCATSTMRLIFGNAVHYVSALRPPDAPEEHATLDDWLAALYRGEFPALDPPGQGRERNGYDLLETDRPTRRRFIAQRDRLHRTWPRLCTSCHAEFSPGRRGIRRCPACRSGPEVAHA